MFSERPSHQVIWAAILFEATIGALALLVGLLMDVPPWQQLYASAIDLGWGVVACGPMLMGLVVCRSLRRGAFGELNRVVDELLVPMFRGATLWQLALISALAGIGEELLFRGVLQPVLSGWTGIWLAIAITSVLFGLAHWVTPLYGILAAIVSAYLGWLMTVQENLMVPIIAHGLYDFVALMYLVRRRRHPVAHE